MLSLDSPDWARLTHCYGPAVDIPALLYRLASEPWQHDRHTDEPWFTLWSALCHQDEAFEASYAAVPHIVAIAVDAVGPIDFSFFLLPASIEIARLTRRAPVLEPALAGPYLAALRDLHHVAYLHAGDPWDRHMTLSVATALAATKGDIALARALGNLDDRIIGRIVDDDL